MIKIRLLNASGICCVTKSGSHDGPRGLLPGLFEMDPLCNFNVAVLLKVLFQMDSKDSATYFCHCVLSGRKW